MALKRMNLIQQHITFVFLYENFVRLKSQVASGKVPIRSLHKPERTSILEILYIKYKGTA